MTGTHATPRQYRKAIGHVVFRVGIGIDQIEKPLKIKGAGTAGAAYSLYANGTVTPGSFIEARAKAQ